MSHADEGSSTASTSTWALQRATEELYDTKDAEVIARRAREIAREGRARPRRGSLTGAAFGTSILVVSEIPEANSTRGERRSWASGKHVNRCCTKVRSEAP